MKPIILALLLLPVLAWSEDKKYVIMVDIGTTATMFIADFAGGTAFEVHAGVTDIVAIGARTTFSRKQGVPSLLGIGGSPSYETWSAGATISIHPFGHAPAGLYVGSGAAFLRKTQGSRYDAQIVTGGTLGYQFINDSGLCLRIGVRIDVGLKGSANFLFDENPIAGVLVLGIGFAF
jgi:hypothetical protein